jgi:hypothetical protein
VSIQPRANVVAAAAILASIYVGLEIDYRHWSWIVFLILVPLALAAAMIFLHVRKTGSRTVPVTSKPKKRRR